MPRVALLALLIATVGAIALSWLVAGRLLQPLRAITRHARDASQHTLSDRIALGGPRDELRELADTMDAMLARLQAAFDSQRHFAAQASHELRTPLAIIQAEADVALASPDALPRERDLALAVRTAAVRSERLVDGLLTLSRSESSMIDSVPLDLADLTGDVVGDLIGEADAAGLAIDLRLDAAPVEGDRALLERLIVNLIRNAIRYNRPDGWVRIAVAGDGVAQPRTAVLSVVNAGPAVPAGEVEALFQPFRRGTGAARARVAGFGLGLSIVRSVATVHGGEVTARPGPDGGLEVRVELPIRGAGQVRD